LHAAKSIIVQVSDFDFDLPERLIASHPARTRTGSRLLSLDAARGRLSDHMFVDLANMLREGDLLVLNDTKVIKARMFARKATGGRTELLVERVLDPHRVLAHLRASKTPKPGSALVFEDGSEVAVVAKRGELFELAIPPPHSAAKLMARFGAVPLPPYIKRAPEPVDEERYQTVYAEVEGAVAAPTAGLHFDEAMLTRLRAQGVGVDYVTLHVGAGTFQPVRVEQVEAHRMHAEQVDVTAGLCKRVKETRERRGRVIAVGTTSVRCLEAASQAGEIEPFRGDTRLFVYPGYRFRCVDALLTNFHLPCSTLLMLVCAFAGRERVLAAYRHAIAQSYRFFSYGDAMFITPAASTVET